MNICVRMKAVSYTHLDVYKRQVQDIQVYYGMIQALKGVSFSVNEGEVIALIGANGAGKTTTLHTVCLLYTSRCV